MPPPHVSLHHLLFFPDAPPPPLMDKQLWRRKIQKYLPGFFFFFFPPHRHTFTHSLSLVHTITITQHWKHTQAWSRSSFYLVFTRVYQNTWSQSFFLVQIGTYQHACALASNPPSAAWRRSVTHLTKAGELNMAYCTASSYLITSRAAVVVNPALYKMAEAGATTMFPPQQLPIWALLFGRHFGSASNRRAYCRGS